MSGHGTGEADTPIAPFTPATYVRDNVIGLAAIVIGEVLMGRLTSFYWKLTSVVVGSVIYFVIRAVVLRMGMYANDMKLLSAVIVALALCIPVALAKYRLRKDYSEGGEE